MSFVLTTAVKELLELADLDESYFMGELGNSQQEELADRPGFYRSVCLLAQYSPFDPETGVWRKVEVFLRKQGNRWEVYDVRGLKIRGRQPSTG